MSVDEEDSIVCEKPKVGDTEIVRIRSNKEREDLNKKVLNRISFKSSRNIRFRVVLNKEFRLNTDFYYLRLFRKKKEEVSARLN